MSFERDKEEKKRTIADLVYRPSTERKGSELGFALAKLSLGVFRAQG